jgi:hypothetical protein
MIERRHLLVVASQCERMAALALLESAAAELHHVLLDPAFGSCLPGLPDGRSLCVGTLAADEVRAEIRVAIEYAEKAGATLVLALLGHGFVPGNTNDLHMMVAGSREGDTLSSVSVSKIFSDAVDRLSMTGVIGIVDTCSAAAAIPEMGRLLQGNAAGRTRIALLMAAAVQQSAVEFRLARGLAKLLRDGVLGADRFLDVPTAYKELRRSKDGHRLVKFDYDGSLPDSSLWLGHNRQHSRITIGRSGRAALTNVLAKLSPPHATPTRWNTAALTELHEELADYPESITTAWALRIVDSLLVAMRTTDLLQSLLPEALDTPRLRRAMAAAGVSLPRGVTTGTDDVAELVERVALWYPATDENCRAQMTKFVMALVGSAGKPFDLPEITEWAKTIEATVQVNNAASWARQLSERKRLRLIVSLHAAGTGDWPELLETWLLLDGRLDDGGRRRIPCTADRAGVEQAIIEALDHAEERAYLLRLRLDHIDVAVPSKLLLDWQPEKIERGEWIGTDFTVVMRWSERLNPSKEVQRLHRSATRRLQDIDTHLGGAPVDWLDHLDTHDLPALREKLVRGNYRRAVALDRCPSHGEHLFSLLLAHIPILLWPQPTSDQPLEDHDCLDVCWDRMPDELILAYRREWRDEAAEPVAKLRAVWDDREWLDFCRAYQRGTNG